MASRFGDLGGEEEIRAVGQNAAGKGIAQRFHREAFEGSDDVVRTAQLVFRIRIGDGHAPHPGLLGRLDTKGRVLDHQAVIRPQGVRHPGF